MISPAPSETQTREGNLLRLFIALLKQDQANVISETEPWGTLLATEAKRNETRTWPAPPGKQGQRDGRSQGNQTVCETVRRPRPPTVSSL